MTVERLHQTYAHIFDEDRTDYIERLSALEEPYSKDQ